MNTVAVVLADGFEEIEAVTVIDVLRRADVLVSVVGVDDTTIRGAHDIWVQADLSLEDAKHRTFSWLVLPGGMPGATRLRDHPTVQSLIQAQHAQGRGLAAICAAPIALAKAGVITGRRVTCYPGFEDQLGQVNFSEDRVVVEDRLITSRGPGTAIDFSLALVSAIRGSETARRLETGMLQQRPEVQPR
jgi:protein deglycase